MGLMHLSRTRLATNLSARFIPAWVRRTGEVAVRVDAAALAHAAAPVRDVVLTPALSVAGRSKQLRPVAPTTTAVARICAPDPEGVDK
jgi:hypothetical protein